MLSRLAMHLFKPIGLFFRITHENPKAIKQRFCESNLPRIKPTVEHSMSIKHPVIRQAKRTASTILPPITRHTPSSSTVNINNPMPITSNLETMVSPAPSPISCSSAVHDAAQRFILRNNLAKLAHHSSSFSLAYNLLHRRSTLYNHVQAKIDTGLPRLDNKQSPEPQNYRLEPSRPVNWSVLKHEIEQDIHIRAHSNRIQFNGSVTYATQITNLGNLVRTKIKSHLSSTTGSGDERYKIIVHLTVFPTAAAGLHVASRCLWNAQTDNSITVKMQGVDCNILIIAFLCYTDLGAI